MKGSYKGREVEFEVRPGTLDAYLTSALWEHDDYRVKPIQEKDPNIKKILEVGGHIGVFTVFAALLWPEALIRTFEAWKENYDFLIKHCSEFPNIKAFNIAVIGSDEEMVTFRLPHRSQNNTGDGRIDNPDMDNSHFDEGTIEVKACSILTALGDWKFVDLMKLDCEGSELPILESLEKNNLLGSIRWIRGEWHGGDKNRDRIQEFLSGTHKVEFEETKNTHGLFWGEAK
jgi:FkbM family methyltransferase